MKMLFEDFFNVNFLKLTFTSPLSEPDKISVKMFCFFLRLLRIILVHFLEHILLYSNMFLLFTVSTCKFYFLPSQLWTFVSL